MASTQTWSEFNGASAATETASRADDNWKNADDSVATVYSAQPITAGNNSFGKYQAVVFNGTWNSLSALTYKVSTTAPATGVTIVGSVVTAGTTPATTATGDSTTNMTTGITSNFNSSTTPYGTGTSSTTASGKIYANVFRTQLQSTSGAGPGDIPSVTITASWTES